MFKKIIASLLTTTLFLSIALPTTIHAKANESLSTIEEITPSIEIDIFSDYTITEHFVINGENYELTVEDITPLNQRNTIEEHWGIGTRTKRVTLGSITSKLLADFSITTTPYTASVNKVTNGDYTSLLGTFISEGYTYSVPSTSDANTPSIAKYYVKYTTLLGGTLEASLTGFAYVGGRVLFKAMGV